MRVLFRCDAGPIRGSGHLVRCLTLADALKASGVESVFACRAEAGSFLDLVRDRGYALHTLPAGAAIEKTEDIWDDATQRDDFVRCHEALNGQVFDWVVVDHYGLSAAWEREARSLGAQILVIDDLANRAHDCDVLLDQNEYADKEHRYDALVPSACRLLLGGAYALLRPEFAAARAGMAPRAGQPRTLMIMMGGADYRGQSLRLTKITKPIAAAHGLDVDLVLGGQNGDRAAIEEIVADDPRFSLHINHRDVASLMREADLAFGAGGTATWEFCCLGVPLLMLSFADNQIKIGQDAGRLGFVDYLGHFDAVTDAEIGKELIRIVENPELRQSLRDRACAIVDGRGSARVCAAMAGELS